MTTGRNRSRTLVIRMLRLRRTLQMKNKMSSGSTKLEDTIRSTIGQRTVQLHSDIDDDVEGRTSKDPSSRHSSPFFITLRISASMDEAVSKRWDRRVANLVSKFTGCVHVYHKRNQNHHAVTLQPRMSTQVLRILSPFPSRSNAVRYDRTIFLYSDGQRLQILYVQQNSRQSPPHTQSSLGSLETPNIPPISVDCG